MIPAWQEWPERERTEGENRTNQSCVILQIALGHLLPYAWHDPDLFQTIAQTHSKKASRHSLRAHLWPHDVTTGFVQSRLF